MKNLLKWLGQDGLDEPGRPDPAEEEADEERRFECDFRKTLVSVEKILHTSSDRGYILQQAIIATCKFYEADWCGILLADAATGVWQPAAWYEEGLGWMSETLFHEFEFFENFPRWVKALGTQDPVIIADCDALKDTEPEEYEHYMRLHAHCVMGIPFGQRPAGFLVLRNAAKYKTIPDFLRIASFVIMNTYFVEQLVEGQREALEETEEDGRPKSICVHIFGEPEISNGFGHLSVRQYKSDVSWKILVYLALREKPASSRMIAEALFPDEDPEEAAEKIRGYFYRLRIRLQKVIDPDKIFVTTDSGYSINWAGGVETDAKQMEKLIAVAKNETDIRRRIDILKEVQELYRGSVYAEFASEHWLRLDETRYNLMYLEATDFLLEELKKLKDYPCMQEFASRSMQKVQGNVDIYYGLFLALKKMGAKDTALKEWQDARQVLSEEEIQELEARLEGETES